MCSGEPGCEAVPWAREGRSPHQEGRAGTRERSFLWSLLQGLLQPRGAAPPPGRQQIPGWPAGYGVPKACKVVPFRPQLLWAELSWR